MKKCFNVAINLLLTLWMLLVGLLMVPFVFLAACWMQFRLRHLIKGGALQDEDEYDSAPVIIEAEKGRDYRPG
ncbi:hypothetical protein R50073_47660 [Maricurvus nonylphenolicus]|uniref:hypothetical protein n=1 Tax=Maricurvus nonylphenolicus TaxID=1008307 RepID=UPI0036F3E94D